MVTRVLGTLVLTGATLLASGKPPAAPPITAKTRMELIRLLNAEFAWARKPFPIGQKGLVIKPNGQLTPNDAELYNLVVQKGQSAKAGERVQITNVQIEKKAILLEVNGGPVKKKKWYQHIQVSGPAGGTLEAAQPDQLAKGSFLLVEYKDYVPEMTLADFKETVKPVFDFTVKSAAQAYTETLPENVRNAIRDHQILVGMSKEMVMYAKGRPPQRVREKDEQGREYEEWIYGQPPADVEFARFIGDEVTQLKIMKVGEEKLVKTQREVNVHDPSIVTAAAATEKQEQEKAQQENTVVGKSKQPSLRRPGETPPEERDRISGPPPQAPQTQPPPPKRFDSPTRP